jgi:hypothetical protein
MDPNPFSNPDMLKAGASILGGTVHSAWLSCETCEFVWIVEMPGNIDVTSMTMMNLTRGNTAPMRITPLLSPEEAVKAIGIASATMGCAETMGYRMESGRTSDVGVTGSQETAATEVSQSRSLDNPKPLDVTRSLFEVSEQYPELIDIFANAGFPQARNKLIRASVGRTMSLKSTLAVIAKDGIDLAEALRAAGFTLME